MAGLLKDETILDEWATVVDGGAGHATEVFDAVEDRLEAAQIPGGCDWSLEEVKAGGLFSKSRRDFLIIELKAFKDYRIYVSAWDYGIHLHVCRFLTAKGAGMAKKLLAGSAAFMVNGTFNGGNLGVPEPGNVLAVQDLRAWLTVVHRAVLESVSGVMDTLGQDAGRLRRESTGALQVW